MQTTSEALRVLGLTPGATREEIIEAYRDLCLVWHPDKHHSNDRLRLKAEEMMKQINGAYELLLNVWDSPTREKVQAEPARAAQAHTTETHAGSDRQTKGTPVDTSSCRKRSGPEFVIEGAALLSSWLTVIGFVSFLVHHFKVDLPWIGVVFVGILSGWPVWIPLYPALLDKFENAYLDGNLRSAIGFSTILFLCSLVLLGFVVVRGL